MRDVRRGVLLLLGALLAISSGAACVAGRERIDSPRLTLVLDDSVATLGDSVRGSVTGVDATGITTLAVFLCTRDSTRRERLDFVREDSATIEFAFALPTTARATDEIEIQAVAFDNQNFMVDTALVLVIESEAIPYEPPRFPGAGLCNARDEPLP